MLVRTLIKDNIPPLKTSDTGERALAWMDEFRLRYLPVVNGTNFLGIISESDVLGLSDKEKKIESYSLPLDRVFIFDNQHVYDAVKFVSNYKYPVVPVLDSENKYAGIITVMDLIDCFADLNAVKTPGGIIHLEVNAHDYVLAEIAQLVEANDCSIISLTAAPSADGSKIEIIFKVNRVDLTRVLAALFRYNYNVKEYYHQSEFTEDLQNRYDSFMRYMKV